MNSKGVPLAAVVYVVRFDAQGRPLKDVGGIHIEHSGRTHVHCNAPAALEPLLAATRGCMKLTVGLSMLEVFAEREAGTLLDTPLTEETTEGRSVLPHAGEGW